MITHNGRKYKVYDAHTHAFPDSIAYIAVNTLIGKAHIENYHDGSYGGLFDYERRADRFLLLPIATKPKQAHSVNTWAALKAGGKLVAFGSVHPESDCYVDELDELCALGLRGVKLHPEYQQFFVDDEKYNDLYRHIFARGLVLCFHAGVDLGYPPPLHGSARRIANVCDRFPDGKIIAAHMGGFKEFEDAKAVLAGRTNLWLDTAYVADILEPGQLLELSRLHGTDRVLFATDAPWSPFDSSVNAVLGAGFDEDELENILYGNAARLVGE